MNVFRIIFFGFVFLLLGCNNNSINSCLSSKERSVLKKAEINFKKFLKDKNVGLDASFVHFLDSVAPLSEYPIPKKYQIGFEDFQQSGLVDTIRVDSYPNSERSRLALKWSNSLIGCVKTQSLGYPNDFAKNQLLLERISDKNFVWSVNRSAALMLEDDGGLQSLEFENEAVFLWILIDFYIEPCIRSSVDFE